MTLRAPLHPSAPVISILWSSGVFFICFQNFKNRRHPARVNVLVAGGYGVRYVQFVSPHLCSFVIKPILSSVSNILPIEIVCEPDWSTMSSPPTAQRGGCWLRRQALATSSDKCVGTVHAASLPVRRLILLILLGWASLPALGEHLEWFADAQTAREKAKQENKFVLLDFTGSDWCGWCMKPNSEIFDQPEFAHFAQANLVLVEVDFPHHKLMDQAQKQANARLAHTCHITGYPTIIVLNQDGRQVGRTGDIPGGPGAFIAKLEQIWQEKPPTCMCRTGMLWFVVMKYAKTPCSSPPMASRWS
jgi:thioredoxin-related protein